MTAEEALDLLAHLAERRPRWMRDAACGEHPTELWFGDQGAGQADALAICRTCLVRTDCLDHALRARERFGIWGGTTARQRTKLLREEAS